MICPSVTRPKTRSSVVKASTRAATPSANASGRRDCQRLPRPPRPRGGHMLTWIGRITVWRPSNWSRRWTANGVWLWRSRFARFSFGKMSLDAKKIGPVVAAP